MNLSHPFRTLAVAIATIGMLSPSSQAQLHLYEGPGLKQELDIDGLAPKDILATESGHFCPGPGGADLAVLATNGNLYLRPGYRFFGGYHLVATGVYDIALLDGESRDQLVHTDGTELYRMDWPSEGNYSWIKQGDPGNSMGGDELVTVTAGLGGDSGVVAISNGGTILSLYRLDGQGSWSRDAALFSSVIGQGLFHDAAVGNFTGIANETHVAILTDNGMTFRNLDGSTSRFLPDYAGTPNGAFLMTLDGDGFNGGRDMVLRHSQLGRTGYFAEVIHSTHYEAMFVEGLGLKSYGFLDFQGDGYKDLIFPTMFGEMFVATNSGNTPDGTTAIFALTSSPDNPGQISLNDAPYAWTDITPGAQTFVLAQDLNFDSIEELVAVGPRGNVWTMPNLCSSPTPEIQIIEMTGEPGDGVGRQVEIDFDFNSLGTGTVDLDIWMYEWDPANNQPLRFIKKKTYWNDPEFRFAFDWANYTFCIVYVEPYLDGVRQSPSIHLWHVDQETIDPPLDVILAEREAASVSPWAPAGMQVGCRIMTDCLTMDPLVYEVTFACSAVTGGTPPRPTPDGSPLTGDNDSGGRGGD